MIVNFLWQIFLFLVCIVVIHSCWIYIQENILRKKNSTIPTQQIEKYENMIQELQSQNSEKKEAPSPTETDVPSPPPPPPTSPPPVTMEQDLDTFMESLL